MKRKGDEPVVDATQEKIAKLKEVAAEKLEEVCLSRSEISWGGGLLGP